ncbi:kinase-like domain-containing protein [Tanacetum coccineum]
MLKWVRLGGLKWEGLGGETGTETWVELGGFGGEMVALGVDLGVEIGGQVGTFLGLKWWVWVVNTGAEMCGLEEKDSTEWAAYPKKLSASIWLLKWMRLGPEMGAVTGGFRGYDGLVREKDMALGRLWAGRNIISSCGVYNIKNRSADGPETAHTTSESNTENDRGSQRIKIRLQVARGLSYPHTSEGDKQEIVYCDIKIANILLGENLDARVDDFGLYKFLSVNEEHKGKAGTPVYMDPQYAKEGKLKKELDIYSLGVVLIEILCGQLAYNPIYRSDDNRGLALTVRQQFDKGTVKTMVDGRLELSLKSATRPN